MLGLTLREEFRGKRLKGTAIELSNDQQTGATQIAAQQFLEITYPTHDLLKGIEAVGPSQGRPVVVIGERGLGKSHDGRALPRGDRPRLDQIMAQRMVRHAGRRQHRQDRPARRDARHRREPASPPLQVPVGCAVREPPHGTYIKGKWEGQGASKTEIPSDKLIVELLENKPTMLLLDEFQTWYDGLTNTKQYPWKNWAFNFIQILSEIAKERPTCWCWLSRCATAAATPISRCIALTRSPSTSRQVAAPSASSRIAAGCCCTACSTTACRSPAAHRIAGRATRRRILPPARCAFCRAGTQAP